MLYCRAYNNLSLFLAIFALANLFLASTAESKTLDISIINNTNVVEDEQLYIFIKAGKEYYRDDMSPVDYSKLDLSRDRISKPCAVAVDLNSGLAHCNIIADESEFDVRTYSFSLADLKSTAKTILLEPMVSGRIYFALGQKLYFNLVKDATTGQLTIVDPDGFQPKDPNYNVLYDKVEFTFDALGSWINPTAVDFFSLPIRINQPNATGDFKQSGIKISRQEALTHLHQVFIASGQSSSSVWQRLFLNYDSNTLLRFIAPGKAAVNGIINTTPFPDDYLSKPQFGNDSSYIDAVWQYYQENTLTIDVTSLGLGSKQPKNPDFASKTDKSSSLKERESYLLDGKVVGDQFIFTPIAGSNSPVIIEKPQSSIPFFAGANGVFHAINNTPKAIIVRQLTAAFTVGLLPALDQTILDQAYFNRQKENDKYFHKNDLLGALAGGPWYDLYSQALHSFGDEQPLYSFAYDDALGQDGTIFDAHASPVTITIGDITGTTLPDPTQDNHSYKVVLNVDNNIVQYNGKAIQQGMEPIAITGGLPLVVNGEEVSLYLQHQVFIPYKPIYQQIQILKPHSRDNDNEYWQVNFPHLEGIDEVLPVIDVIITDAVVACAGDRCVLNVSWSVPDNQGENVSYLLTPQPFVAVGIAEMIQQQQLYSYAATAGQVLLKPEQLPLRQEMKVLISSCVNDAASVNARPMASNAWTLQFTKGSISSNSATP